MSVLLNLPSDLSTALLSEWVIIHGFSLKNLIDLDSAVCNRTLRPKLEDLFSKLTYNVNLTLLPYKEYLEDIIIDVYDWLGSRRFHSQRLTVRQDVESLLTVAAPWFPEIRALSFATDCSMDTMTQIANACSSLCDLTCQSIVIPFISPDRLKTLTKINITYECSNETLAVLAAHCTNLQSLGLKVPQDNSLVLPVVAANPRLQYFHFNGASKGLLECLAAHCTQLQCLYLVRQDLDLSALVKVVERCPRLEDFRAFCLIEWTKRARRLELRSLDEPVYLKSLLHHWTGLQALTLDRIAFGHMAESVSALLAASGSTLKRLVVRNCPGLSAALLRQIIIKCRQLCELTLMDMAHLDSSELPGVFEADSSQSVCCSLWSLTISGTDLTQECVAAVVVACENLESGTFAKVQRSDETASVGLPSLESLCGRPCAATGAPLQLNLCWKQ